MLIRSNMQNRMSSSRINLLHGCVKSPMGESEQGLKVKLDQLNDRNRESKKKIKTLQQARRRLCRKNEKLAKRISLLQLQAKKIICSEIDYEDAIGNSARHESSWTDLSDEEPAEKLKQKPDRNCRLCSKRCTKYVPIFGDREDKRPAVAEKISICLPIIVLPTDNLPLDVCEKCLRSLNITYQLIVDSAAADEKFRSRLTECSDLQNEDSIFFNENDTLVICNKKLNVELNDREEARVPSISIEAPVTCDLCNEVFKDMELFDDHVEEVHFLQWRCNLCDHSFVTSEELIGHKKLNHTGQLVTCNDCVDPQTVEESAMETFHEESEADPLMTEKLVDKKCSPALTVTTSKRLNGSEPFGEHDSTLNKRKIFKKELNMDAIYTCDSCGKIFANESQLERHKERHCPKIFEFGHCCKYCNKIYSSNQELVLHLRTHKKEMLQDPSVTVYKCVTCPKTFVDKSLYQKHRNIHDPEVWDKYRCSICNRSFMDGCKLRAHQTIHQGLKPYSCDICGRSFNRFANMRLHQAIHSEPKCSHCNETFDSRSLLTKHLQEAHGLQQQPKKQYKKSNQKVKNGCSICRFCGKQLATYDSLISHERIHTGDKPFTCEHCGKSFRTYTGRWQHMLRHEKSNYVCEHCGKTYSSKPNLSRHLQIHVPIEERKYQCADCGKKFYWKRHLDVHIRVHTGARPYTCDICPSSFSQRGDLKRHRSTHFKEYAWEQETA